MNKTLAYILLATLSISCFKKEDEREPVARVFDTMLYKEDLLKILPKNLNKDDSLLFVKTYINSWAREQLMLNKAKINLKEDETDINELVNKYREDLLIDKYKEAIVEQELDTIITPEDVQNFYDQNKEIFKLNEELLKFKYIYFDNNVLNPKEFIMLFKSNSKESETELIKQELQLKSYNLNDSIWIRYDDIIRNEPFLKQYDKDKFLKKNNFIHKEDSTGVFLVKVKDVLLRNDIAPISYAMPTIKQMILHKRKLELLRKIEETLTEDAIKNKEFHIY